MGLEVICGPMFCGKTEELIRRVRRATIAGLATTYEGKPFPPIPHLMAIADEVLKLSAICNICGKEAVFHIKKKKSGVNPLKITSALIGGTKDYEARCRECFKKG